MKHTFGFLFLILGALGCSQGSRTAATEETTGTAATTKQTLIPEQGAEAISAQSLLRHVQVLASDAFEGRAPGSVGEDSTVQYLTRQFKQMGLQPGNPDGTYVQQVPLYGYSAKPVATFDVGKKKIQLEFPKDYVAGTRRYVPQIDVKNSEMVFVGYGVVAPEYGWDDYKGLDVKGKTIVMLINDPAVPDPNDPGKLDDSIFKGNAMTYYGRWTYKYEIAAEKGAAAAVIIHETGPAGYPYEVVSGSWSNENFDIMTQDRNMSRAAVEAWITEDKARQLFQAAGKDFGELKKAAVQKDFKPVPLGATASFRFQNKLRQVQSQNVVAKLEGSDPQLKNEYVVYSAHWDHLGRNKELPGDQIYNGALDNATGTAGLLELAKAFSQGPRPKRSILFLAVTAEEQGLLGSKYYAANPLYPLEKTLANINMDVLNWFGPTKDVIIIGYGNSTLDDVLTEVASTQGRVTKPDATPEKGSFYRSDHFEFAKLGVPALYSKYGDEVIGKPAGFGQEQTKAYTANDYHKVTDEVKPTWDLSGAVQDLQLLYGVGYQVAQGEEWPEWKPGTEFKARREAMLR
jgi:Zn-dependent M28 family amino/carboxypeptidase